MGCGSSKGVVVPSNCNVRKSTTSIKESCTSKKNTSAKNSRTSLRSDKNNISPGSSAADFDENSGKRREISASSTRTADSGISESPQDEDVVTELSNPSKVIEVRASERPDTPDLVLEGIACPRKQSGKERKRLELQKRDSESSVPKLPPLPSNSLSERPKTRGGLAFDITFCPETGNMKKAQLPKLEKRKKKKKLTKEQLEEKMRKAEERRQQHNKKIQDKSHFFFDQHESFVQMRHAQESQKANEENLDNTRENVTEIVKISENDRIDLENQ